MKPGRELDALVAERVMGLELWQHDGRCGCKMAGDDYLDSYSTHLPDAWKVVEKFPGMVLSFGGLYPWCCCFQSQTEWADTAPHAICLAALKAIGVKAEA